MAWVMVIMVLAAASLFGLSVVPVLLVLFGAMRVRRRLLNKGNDQRKLPGRPNGMGAKAVAGGCPEQERKTLNKLDKRLETARAQCLEALDAKLSSELARARVEPPLEDAYRQLRAEIDAIYAFCERNDLVGTLKKAESSVSAKDIYQAAYERDLAKVRGALQKTEACLAAYERTVATLEVSSVEADIASDFDASIEMLRELRDELPLYSLEDRV